MSDPQTNFEFDVRRTVNPELVESTLARYRRQSENAVATLRGFEGLYYDPHSQQKLDIWGTSDELRPVFMAIHGGYWKALSRHDTAFMAHTLDAKGIATVTVDHGLAPGTSLEEIVRQIRAAVAWIYHRGAAHGLDRERIVVGGSSSGAYLAGSLMMTGWQPEFDVPANVIGAALLISGLFDLRPLVDSFVNEWLDLDLNRAEALSPMLFADQAGPPAIIAVAEHDGIAFLDQSRQFHHVWSNRSKCELLVVPNRNHYDISLDLANPHSELTCALVRLIQICSGS